MTIITTIDELKKYVEVSKSLKIETVGPSLKSAGRRHLKDCLGPELFLRLIKAYQDAGLKVSDMSDELKELAELCQAAAANIGMSLLIPRVSISISESGISRLENDNQKTAYQYQEVNAKESYLRSGYDALEDIFIYLEEHKELYPDWVASSAYLDFKKYFIQSAAEFSSLYNIQQSRLSFLAVRYIMKRIEDFQVKDIISKKLFDTIKSQVKSGTITPQNRILLDDFICPGVALITIAKGVWERALDISEYGVTISMRGSSGNNELRQAAELKNQQKMADQLLADGNLYLSQLGVFLEENKSDYPDYEPPKVESLLFTIKNKKDNGIYSV
ncbi:DUF6712 family protein [Pedobacter gandavensis]|uniref:Uncharacterized protein n=1 Tax=Pedobacter gandavensis TaxID=2679963 RepID=A0ABR6EXL6_9SPHI|nr:DUF6712 family protein [Pedobacter gandavensis]MBB2149173.1 hypothetical protein [Pedobacter gandavensis]